MAHPGVTGGCLHAAWCWSLTSIWCGDYKQVGNTPLPSICHYGVHRNNFTLFLWCHFCAFTWRCILLPANRIHCTLSMAGNVEFVYSWLCLLCLQSHLCLLLQQSGRWLHPGIPRIKFAQCRMQRMLNSPLAIFLLERYGKYFLFFLSCGRNEWNVSWWMHR